MEIPAAKTRISVILGDITTIASDAIVNAANSTLLGGGGVDGAIHRAGGPAILEECRKIVAKQGSCPTGEAVITIGGRLPAKYVIHTVGPVWNGGSNREPEKLASCYKNSLNLAVEYNCKTIAFPSISTGIYGYPKEKAAIIAIDEVVKFLLENSCIEQVLFICFDNESKSIYDQLLGTM